MQEPFQGETQRLLLPTDWVAHHVTGGIGRNELPAYLVQRSPIVVSNRYDVALRMPHTRYFFMDDDGLAITDQRTQPLQSVTIDCPSRVFRQMISCTASGLAASRTALDLIEQLMRE
jgi:hypothetical protein